MLCGHLTVTEDEEDDLESAAFDRPGLAVLPDATAAPWKDSRRWLSTAMSAAKAFDVLPERFMVGDGMM